MTLKVVLGEDNYLVREGMRHILATEPGLELVGTAGDRDELVALVDTHRPDVVLTDIRMPPGHVDEGLQVAEHCRRTHPRTGVILLSQYMDPAWVRLLLAQGTEGRGYLLKERVADVDDLLLAVREVARGGSALDPAVVDSLVRAGAAKPSGPLGRLTTREREVLAAMARGLANASIAEQLVLSSRAVEKHINSIFLKLGMRGCRDTHPRVRAVLLYLAAAEG